jgi:FHA domain-containing protein
VVPNLDSVGAAGPSRRWSLVVEGPQGTGFERALELDAYLLGRDPSCSLCLPAREVSKQHASLARDREGFWWLTDEGSTTGTFVNGVRCHARTRLLANDVVHVGPYRLALRPDHPVAEQRRRWLPPPAERRLPPPPRLRLYDGRLAGCELRVDRGEVRLGGPHATVPLDAGRFAGIEVAIRPRPDGDFEVEDLSATPSLLANGRPVRSVRLGARGNDVVLLLGPVEAVRAEPSAGFRVRYMAGERGPGEATPAPPGEGVGAEGAAEAEGEGVPWAAGSTPASGSPSTPPRDTEREPTSASPSTPPRDTERDLRSVPWTEAPAAGTEGATAVNGGLLRVPPDEAQKAREAAKARRVAEALLPTAEEWGERVLAAFKELGPGADLEEAQRRASERSNRVEVPTWGPTSPRALARTAAPAGRPEATAERGAARAEAARTEGGPLEVVRPEAAWFEAARREARRPEGEGEGGAREPAGVAGAAAGPSSPGALPASARWAEAEPDAGAGGQAEAAGAVPRRGRLLAIVLVVPALVGMVLTMWLVPKLRAREGAWQEPAASATASATAARARASAPERAAPVPSEPERRAAPVSSEPERTAVPSPPRSVATAAEPVAAPSIRRKVGPVPLPAAKTAPAPKHDDEGRNASADDDARAALRRQLEAKANAGKVSQGELQHLLSLCAQTHDVACVTSTRARMATKEAP